MDSSNEFRKAGERIQDARGIYKGGRPAAKALAWALNFSQEDPTTYSHGEWSNKWAEVKRFAQDAGLGQDEPPITHAVKVRVWPELAFPGSIEKRALRTMQCEAKAYFEIYVKKGQVRTNGILLDLSVSKAVSRVSVLADLHPSFLYQVFHLLADCGPRIRQCQGCERFFLAGRSDKKWCSGICQATIWKREHPRARGKKQPTSKKRGKRHGTKK